MQFKQSSQLRYLPIFLSSHCTFCISRPGSRARRWFQKWGPHFCPLQWSALLFPCWYGHQKCCPRAGTWLAFSGCTSVRSLGTERYGLVTPLASSGTKFSSTQQWHSFHLLSRICNSVGETKITHKTIRDNIGQNDTLPSSTCKVMYWNVKVNLDDLGNKNLTMPWTDYVLFLFNSQLLHFWVWIPKQINRTQGLSLVYLVGQSDLNPILYGKRQNL